MNKFPEKIETESDLEELLSRPGDGLSEFMSRIEGDILFLGISGKIGPSLASMARRACTHAGVKKRIMGVSRSCNREQQAQLESLGVETIQGDLLDIKFLKSLPSFENIFFLAGMKFGATDNLPATWAINTYLPALISERFRESRIAVFSTGCVYPLVKIESGGSVETDPPVAIGEYAQSCLGRERMFEYGSRKHNNKSILIRLNYSVEPRYGVLVDIALKVKNRIPVDLTMGYFNAIWQGDMNNQVLRSLEYSQVPPRILNITGPEILSVRETAIKFGQLFGHEPVFINKESETALLSNASEAISLFGSPEVAADQIIRWTAQWLIDGNRLLDKPTHFEVRDGKF